MRRSRIKVMPNVGRRSGATPAPAPPAPAPAPEASKDDDLDKREPETTAKSDTETKNTAQQKPEDTTKDKSENNPPAASRRSRIKPQVRLPVSKAAAVSKPAPPAQDEKISEKQPGVKVITSNKADVSFSEMIGSPKGVTLDSEGDSQQNAVVIDSSMIEIVSREEAGADSDAVITDDKASPTPQPTLPKRGRLPRPRPNVANAEMRRARLSSFSDQEDFTPLKKPKHLQTSAGGEKSTSDTGEDVLDTSNTREDKSKAGGVEDKPVKRQTKKTKRRVSQKLDEDTLVSENRSRFTISDLIHMNPTRNPMKRYKKDLEDPKPESIVDKASTPPPPDDVSSTRSDQPEEDNDVVAMDVEDSASTSLAPQVMIGPDGNIILNDASLVVDNPAAQADKSIVEGDVVVENDNYNPSFYYKRKERSQAWSIKETCKFYVALSTVGTDFSLMSALFPKRNRIDLKRKFKFEERKHKTLIDRALTQRRELDMSIFDLSDEEEGGDENVPEGDIKQVVRKELQKESSEKKDSRKGRKRKEKPPKPDKPAKEPKKPPAAKKPKKKPKKAAKSRYYVNSESEEEDHQEEEEVNLDLPDDEEQVVSSSPNDSPDEDTYIVEKVTSKKTRAGRQPKAPKPFKIEAPVRRPRKKSMEALSQIMNLTPGATTKGVIEDEVTGQRLLLVKSPPPVGLAAPGRATPSEFVHVYLLSPSVPRPADDGELTGHRPRSGSSPEGMKKLGESVTIDSDESREDIEAMSVPVKRVRHLRTQSESAHPSEVVQLPERSPSPEGGMTKLKSPPKPTRQLASPATVDSEASTTLEGDSEAPTIIEGDSEPPTIIEGDSESPTIIEGDSEPPSILEGDADPPSISEGDVESETRPTTPMSEMSCTIIESCDNVSKDKASETLTHENPKQSESTETPPPPTDEASPSKSAEESQEGSDDSKMFDNSQVTTITTDDGELVEIVFNPGSQGFEDDGSDDEDYSIVNIEFPLGDTDFKFENTKIEKT